jgi:hypothetical protein
MPRLPGGSWAPNRRVVAQGLGWRVPDAPFVMETFCMGDHGIASGYRRDADGGSSRCSCRLGMMRLKLVLVSPEPGRSAGVGSLLLRQRPGRNRCAGASPAIRRKGAGHTGRPRMAGRIARLEHATSPDRVPRPGSGTRTDWRSRDRLINLIKRQVLVPWHDGSAAFAAGLTSWWLP